MSRDFWSALERARSRRLLRGFTWTTRVLLALAFLPSGLTKLLGHRFTRLGVDTDVGFFFEALYRTGAYWRFIGFSQLLAALLLVIPRTARLGAVVYFPLVLNIFVITVAMGFAGTPVITGLMLLGSVYLLLWDAQALRPLVAREAAPPAAGRTGETPHHEPQGGDERSPRRLAADDASRQMEVG